MQTNNLEKFTTRVLFKYIGKGDRDGRDVAYIYNRESLNEVVNIEHHPYENAQFLEIGQEIFIDNRRCKIAHINFKLSEQMNIMEDGYGLNMSSPSQSTNFNLQIGVFLDPLE